MFSEFTRTLDDASIKSYVRPVIDISPVLDLFKEWGPSHDLSTKKLTAKPYWLLSVTGFLRASDIHRIDDERSHIFGLVLSNKMVALNMSPLLVKYELIFALKSSINSHIIPQRGDILSPTTHSDLPLLKDDKDIT
ncbi:hypothetical protein AYI69_g8920 [Smittium culicis]|uniref:Uncharacterized protein n=1 Tax=Smittium culicis TaxID=133412 RepID=A0A1R1XG98_9FUNG|nr:hypothetical protein AYI69_g8920 [Smittium culicis]